MLSTDTTTENSNQTCDNSDNSDNNNDNNFLAGEATVVIADVQQKTNTSKRGPPAKFDKIVPQLLTLTKEERSNAESFNKIVASCMQTSTTLGNSQQDEVGATLQSRLGETCGVHDALIAAIQQTFTKINSNLFQEASALNAATAHSFVDSNDDEFIKQEKQQLVDMISSLNQMTARYTDAETQLTVEEEEGVFLTDDDHIEFSGAPSTTSTDERKLFLNSLFQVKVKK